MLLDNEEPKYVVHNPTPAQVSQIKKVFDAGQLKSILIVAQGEDISPEEGIHEFTIIGAQDFCKHIATGVEIFEIVEFDADSHTIICEDADYWDLDPEYTGKIVLFIF